MNAHSKETHKGLARQVATFKISLDLTAFIITYYETQPSTPPNRYLYIDTSLLLKRHLSTTQNVKFMMIDEANQHKFRQISVSERYILTIAM